MITCQCQFIQMTNTTKLSTLVGILRTSLALRSRQYSHRVWRLHPLTLDRIPCVLPFSQMYPLCCIDIRNFLNQIYLFSDDHFQRSSVIDETLRTVSISKPFSVLDSLTRSLRRLLMTFFARKYANLLWIVSVPSTPGKSCKSLLTSNTSKPLA